MRRQLLIAMLGLWPTFSYSQQITVRSGEHGDFTRLVLSVPEGLSYELERNPDENYVRVKLDQEGLTFDTSTVFSKINTSRVSSLSQIPGGSILEVRMNCTCEVNSFTLRGTMVVLDIREGVMMPSEISLAESAPASREASEIEGLDKGGVPLGSQLSNIQLGGRYRIGPEPVSPPLFDSVSILRPPSIIEPNENGGNGENSPKVIGATIAESLARAASEGLLEAVTVQTPTAESVTLKSNSARPANVASETVTNLSPAILRFRTELSEGDVLSIGAGECLSDADLNIADWSTAPSVSEVLSRSRADLYGEFDKVDESALKMYTRELLYFGFGAEARSTLAALSENPDSALLAISYLVDGDVDPTGFFSSQIECEGLSAFWAALGGGVRRGNAQYKVPGILRGLESLPSKLREYLGPILASRLSEQGKFDLARDIVRRLERLHGGPTNLLVLSSAEIELQDGNIDAAEKNLASINSLPESEAHRALNTSVEIARVRETPVSESMVDLTAAYAAEMRGSEAGGELWRSYVRSLSLNDRYDEAFEALRDGSTYSPEMQREVAEEVIERVVEYSSDIDFLKHAVKGDLDLDHIDSRDLELGIVARMIDIGLPEFALERIDRSTDADDNNDFRLKRAKALLALSRPEEAEIVLVGLRGEDVDSLRAEARHNMGDYTHAGEIYQNIGETEAAINNAWLSGDWERVAQSDDTPFGQAARLAGQSSSPPELPSLRYAEALSQSTTETVDTLRALLEATRVGGTE